MGRKRINNRPQPQYRLWADTNRLLLFWEELLATALDLQEVLEPMLRLSAHATAAASFSNAMETNADYSKAMADNKDVQFVPEAIDRGSLNN